MTETAPVSILTIDSGKLDHNSTIKLTYGAHQAQPPNAVYRVEHSKSKPHLSVYRISSITPQKPPAALSVLGEAPPPYSHPAHSLTPRPPPAQKLPSPSTKASQPDLRPKTLLFPPPPQQLKTFNNSLIGTVSYHKFSSKIECALHDTDIRLARKDPLPSGHNFTHPKFGTFKWTESSDLGSGVELFDENKAKIARFRKRLNNDKRGSVSASEDLGPGKKTKRRLMKTAMRYNPMVKTTSGFEVYVP